MSEQSQETWKISLWVQNDEGLYDMARECQGGDDLENQFIELCMEGIDPRAFGWLILLDLLGPVDWQEVWESVQDEEPAEEEDEDFGELPDPSPVNPATPVLREETFDQDVEDLLGWVFHAPGEGREPRELAKYEYCQDCDDWHPAN